MDFVIQLDFVRNIGQKRIDALKEIIRIASFNGTHEMRNIKLSRLTFTYDER